MGEVEEVQKQMKADMEAMKKKMATMMEAMMSMKKIMEANAVTIATTSTVAKVNLMPPSGLNQMNHPTLDMVGKDLVSTGSPHDVQIQNKHTFPPYGLPLQAQFVILKITAYGIQYSSLPSSIMSLTL